MKKGEIKVGEYYAYRTSSDGVVEKLLILEVGGWYQPGKFMQKGHDHLGAVCDEDGRWSPRVVDSRSLVDNWQDYEEACKQQREVRERRAVERGEVLRRVAKVSHVLGAFGIAHVYRGSFIELHDLDAIEKLARLLKWGD